MINTSNIDVTNIDTKTFSSINSNSDEECVFMLNNLSNTVSSLKNYYFDAMFGTTDKNKILSMENALITNMKNNASINICYNNLILDTETNLILKSYLTSMAVYATGLANDNQSNYNSEYNDIYTKMFDDSSCECDTYRNDILYASNSSIIQNSLNNFLYYRNKASSLIKTLTDTTPDDIKSYINSSLNDAFESIKGVYKSVMYDVTAKNKYILNLNKKMYLRSVLTK